MNTRVDPGTPKMPRHREGQAGVYCPAGPGASVEQAFMAASQVAGSTPAGGPNTAAGPLDSSTPWVLRHSAREPWLAAGSVLLGSGGA
ncbi:hypothetical protein [Mycolicibacterium sp.]|uniref:hypothetical protein n=1 Tax=Mycolicibacterium sp. TaxID=2320850 RepID=UPI0028A84537|nr:hypothetical protein [Mycolicibacterium sp.]